LYEILGVGKRAKNEEIRRLFLGRSRIIHPE
jgi:curved DNA-binding protein CbpA